MKEKRKRRNVTRTQGGKKYLKAFPLRRRNPLSPRTLAYVVFFSTHPTPSLLFPDSDYRGKIAISKSNTSKVRIPGKAESATLGKRI